MKAPHNLFLPGKTHQNFCHVAERGTTLEDVLSAAYWVHLHNKIGVFDVIEVIADDGSFDVDIRLVMKRPGEMKFRIVRQAEIANVEPIVRENSADRFLVRSNGRAGGFRVVEKETGKTVSDGFDKAGAEAERERLEGAQRQAA